MASKRNVRTSGRHSLPVFAWGADRDAALAKARDAGCVLGLWFQLAQQRAKFHRGFSAWLNEVHEKYRARFGVARQSI